MKRAPSTAARRRKFERVVVVLDVAVVVRHKRCKACAAAVFEAVRKILRQCDGHGRLPTMWGFRVLDPSLPPLASSSRIRDFLVAAAADAAAAEADAAQFDSVSANLVKFSKTLRAMVQTNREYACGGAVPRADYVNRALCAVAAEYTWDPLLGSESSSSDEERRRRGSAMAGSNAPVGDSNVVLFVSSVPSSWEAVAAFADFPAERAAADPDALRDQLKRTFQPAVDIFESKNIRAGFLEVPPCDDLWSAARVRAVANPAPARSFFLRALSEGKLSEEKLSEEKLSGQTLSEEKPPVFRRFIPLDLLAAGPVPLPCGLVWNSMADPGDLGAKIDASVRCPKGIALCEVEMLPLFSTRRSPSSFLESAKRAGIVLDSVAPKESFPGKLTSERFLLRQSEGPRAAADSRQEGGESPGHAILQVLKQTSGFLPVQPAWQLLLLTLAREACVCGITISSERRSCKAVLEPFTSHSALVTVLQTGNTSGDDVRSARAANKDIAAPATVVQNFGSKVEEKAGEVSATKAENTKTVFEQLEAKVEVPATKAENPKAALEQLKAKFARNRRKDWYDLKLTVLPKRRRAAPKKDELPKKVELPKEDELPKEFVPKSDECYRVDGAPKEIKWEDYWERVTMPAPWTGFFAARDGCLLDGYMGGSECSGAVGAVKAFVKGATQPIISTCGSEAVMGLECPPIRPEADSKWPISQEDLHSSAGSSTSPSDLAATLPCLTQTLAEDDAESEDFGRHKTGIDAEMHQSSGFLPVADDTMTPAKDESEECTQTRTVIDVEMLQSSGFLAVGEETTTPAKDEPEEFARTRTVIDAEIVQGSRLLAEEDRTSTSAKDCGISTSVAADMTVEEAKQYISSVNERLKDYLSSTNSDNHKFAAMLVAESHKCFSLIEERSTTGDRGEISEEDPTPASSKSLVGNLQKLLLKRPKALMAEEKRLEESNNSTPPSNSVKAFELQILLRMEIMSLDGGSLLDEKKSRRLERDICELLDEIQFHLEGGIFGQNSLRQFCNRLFGERYKALLPDAVGRIRRSMELDNSESSRASGAAATPDGPSSQEQRPDSATVEASSGQKRRHRELKRKAERAADRIPNGTSDDISNATASLKAHLRPSKSLKRVGSYHFASGASKLKRWRTFRTDTQQVKVKRSKSFKVPGPSMILTDEVDIVCQTPDPLFNPQGRSRTLGMSQETTRSTPRGVEAASPRENIIGRLEHSPTVVMETPDTRTRPTSNEERDGSWAGKATALDQGLAKAGPKPRTCLVSSRFLQLGSEIPVPSRDSVHAKQAADCIPISFSALLQSVQPTVKSALN